MRNKVMLAIALSVAVLAALSVPLTVHAQQSTTEWKVGLANAKITPAEPIMMAGYASRKSPSEGVETDLFAKAMAFEDSEGHKALLVTADIIGFPGDITESIAARLKQFTGIPREAVLLNGSHIHTGPVVAVGRSSEFPEEYQQRIRDYAKEFEDKIVAIGEQALANMKPARISWSTGVAHFVMNRREFTPRGVILGVNPRGIADRTVPVMRVEGASGELRAVLYGAATHNTTLTGDHMKLDGD
ncbi:MAG TPA: neutral/alkaline non-lysosomal ceramidase N-terminal domain-containing protein, partial [Verrucomicrobiae bacterium]|nr:neutral/alkaline non-lysosomal ceramidase N-terminal domain-containing protein [Verrucomicrobiae bacterium]